MKAVNKSTDEEDDSLCTPECVLEVKTGWFCLLSAQSLPSHNPSILLLKMCKQGPKLENLIHTIREKLVSFIALILIKCCLATTVFGEVVLKQQCWRTTLLKHCFLTCKHKCCLYRNSSCESLILNPQCSTRKPIIMHFFPSSWGLLYRHKASSICMKDIKKLLWICGRFKHKMVILMRLCQSSSFQSLKHVWFIFLECFFGTLKLLFFCSGGIWSDSQRRKP